MIGLPTISGSEPKRLAHKPWLNSTTFPRPGISIALDVPIRDRTPEIVTALNRRLIELGGRVYLTKDAFTTADELRAMEPRLGRFQEVRRRWDPEGRLRSALSVRLLGDGGA